VLPHGGRAASAHWYDLTAYERQIILDKIKDKEVELALCSKECLADSCEIEQQVAARLRIVAESDAFEQEASEQESQPSYQGGFE